MDPAKDFQGNQPPEARPMSKNKLLEKYFDELLYLFS